MKYKVTKYHHRKAWVRGDLEAETIVVGVEIFATKKAVVDYLKREEVSARNRGYKTTLDSKVRGTMPSLTIVTGTTWIHENTGNEEQEFYRYRTEVC